MLKRGLKAGYFKFSSCLDNPNQSLPRSEVCLFLESDGAHSIATSDSRGRCIRTPICTKTFYASCSHGAQPLFPRVVFSRTYITIFHALFHQGFTCDCCGMNPIVGVRLTCDNVQDVDICSKCATTPGQAFTAGGQPFGDLTWRFISSPGQQPPSSVAAAPAVESPVSAPTPAPAPLVAPAADEDESYISKAGKGATGRYYKGVPDANEYEDSVSYRNAIMEQELVKRAERKAKGVALGNAAANEYMNFLNPPKPKKGKSRSYAPVQMDSGESE